MRVTFHQGSTPSRIYWYWVPCTRVSRLRHCLRWLRHLRNRCRSSGRRWTTSCPRRWTCSGCWSSPRTTGVCAGTTPRSGRCCQLSWVFCRFRSSRWLSLCIRGILGFGWRSEGFFGFCLGRFLSLWGGRLHFLRLSILQIYSSLNLRVYQNLVCLFS